MYKNLIINWVDTIDSTNLEALRSMGTAQEASVWIADFQTAGRGQRGNKWESSRAKNLTFSVLLKPYFLDIEDQFAISRITALALCRYLELHSIKAKIKWPNDIYVEDNKICGVLIEHSICGDKLSSSVVGVGLNLNQLQFDSGAPNPTSLLLELNKISSKDYDINVHGNFKELDRKAELNLFLDVFFNLYDNLKAGMFKEIEQEYDKLLYRFNQFYNYIEIPEDAFLNVPVECISGGNMVEAKIIGIDKNACLILEHKTGIVKSYAFKEIKYII